MSPISRINCSTDLSLHTFDNAEFIYAIIKRDFRVLLRPAYLKNQTSVIPNSAGSDLILRMCITAGNHVIVELYNDCGPRGAFKCALTRFNTNPTNLAGIRTFVEFRQRFQFRLINYESFNLINTNVKSTVFSHVEFIG